MTMIVTTTMGRRDDPVMREPHLSKQTAQKQSIQVRLQDARQIQPEVGHQGKLRAMHTGTQLRLRSRRTPGHVGDEPADSPLETDSESAHRTP